MSCRDIPFRVIAIAGDEEQLRYILSVARNNPDIPLGVMLRDSRHQEHAITELVRSLLEYELPHSVYPISNTYLHFAIPYIHFTSAQLQASVTKGDALLRDSDKCAGCSIHSLEEAKQAEAVGADYLMYGPVFSSPSKPGREGKGTGILREICDTVTLPVFAVSGVSAENLTECLAAGAYGVASISLFESDNSEHLSTFLSLIRNS